MPQKVLQIPDWLKPENRSVFDSIPVQALQKVSDFFGLADPQQVMAVAAGIPVPGGDIGGIAGAVAKRFPRFANAIKAYHGSPADFEQFDSKYIGTGEGAQAYGHGLYFAEQEGTAEAYKRALGNRTFKVGDRELVSPMGGSTRALDTQTRGENIAAQALDDAINAQSSSPAQYAADRLRKQARYYPDEAAHIQDALDVIREWQKSGDVQKMGGKMYEVAINADSEHFLDWDAPISKQPKVVQELVAKRWKGQEAFAPRTGAELYRELGPDRKFGSEWLKERGVPGIKYLDQGSRTAGEGSRNYVVFDDKTVELLRKYGLLLPAVGASIPAIRKQEP